MFTPCLDSLPKAQRTLWPDLRLCPDHFILYGGTAIALRLGHRDSVDFDFFSSQPLNEAGKHLLLSTLPWLAEAKILLTEVNTLLVSAPVDGEPVKISFFGGLRFGCLRPPEPTRDGVLRAASAEDLLAHKLKVLHDRAEGKDYQDIAALLRHGLSLAHGLAAKDTLFGTQYPAMTTLKALSYYSDIHEPWRLTDDDKETIRAAVAALPRAWPPVPLFSPHLAP